MVAMKAPFPVQPHRAKSGTDGSPSGGEDRAGQEHLGMLPDAPLFYSGAKGVKTRIISFGRVCALRSPLFERTDDERTLPLSLSNG